MASRTQVFMIVMIGVTLPACSIVNWLGGSEPNPSLAKVESKGAASALVASQPVPSGSSSQATEGKARESEEASTPAAAERGPAPPPPEGSKEGPPGSPAGTKAGPLGVPGTPAGQQGKPQYVSLNFENADLELVLRSIADITGINFIIGPGIKTNVTMRTTTKIPASEVFSVMESVLEVNNLVAVKDGLYYKIVPIAVAQQEAQDVQVGKERGEERERYVTQIVHLDHLSAEEMARILQSFLARGAKMAVHKETNSLIIAGFSSTVKRLLETIKALDIPGKRDNIQRIFVYFVENVKATDLATILNTLYGRRDVLPRPAAPGARPGLPPPRAGLGVQPPTPPPPTPGQVPLAPPAPPATGQPYPGATLLPGVEPAPGEVVGDVIIVPDDATNALVIKTSPRNYEFIEATIKKLDIVPKQVIIEALLAEVTLTDSLAFSLEAFVNSGSFVVQSLNPLSGSILKGISAAGQLIDKGGLTFTFVEGTRFRTFLNNVATYTKVNILAAPHILTANNKEAKLQIGSEVPIITNEQASLTSVSAPTTGGQVTPAGVFRTVQQKDIGVIIGIKPHINEKRLVTLDIETEQTDILAKSFGDTGSPAFSKRS
ncbi:MAG: hypothetical protein HY278_00100, partial [candidate division NC10 bacterium]|nr:hypothetical protein [candidate division NC10 bacterium]